MHFLTCALSFLLAITSSFKNEPIKGDSGPTINPTFFKLFMEDEQNKPPVPYHTKPKLKKHEHWVPTIDLKTEVTQDSVESVIAQMSQVTDDGAEGVVLVIDSPGGSVTDGFKLSDAMESSPVPITCYVSHMAASMGSYLLESCTNRTMSKEAVLMIHEPAMGGIVAGQPTFWQNTADMMKTLTESMLEHYAKRSNLSIDEIRYQIDRGKEFWLNWQEAYDDGFVDEVVSSLQDLEKSMKKGLKMPKNLAN